MHAPGLCLKNRDHHPLSYPPRQPKHFPGGICHHPAPPLSTTHPTVLWLPIPHSYTAQSEKRATSLLYTATAHAPLSLRQVAVALMVQACAPRVGGPDSKGHLCYHLPQSGKKTLTRTLGKKPFVLVQVFSHRRGRTILPDHSVSTYHCSSRWYTW